MIVIFIKFEDFFINVYDNKQYNLILFYFVYEKDLKKYFFR